MNFCPKLSLLSEITEAYLKHIDSDILNQNIIGINTDTRNLRQGEVFLALEGERFDGHTFLEQAHQKGAIATITNLDNPFALQSKTPQLQVKDTLQAYQKIANWWRESFKIPVIGITGSVGKTTTKELIAAVLKTQGEVLKTEANYNNEIGVPRTLLQLENNHQYAVIEMAMRAKGEIALLTEIANPTIGVITNVGTAHIGRLGSREAIASAKCELLEKMDKSGVAILNHDNQLLIETAQKVWSGETITYGLKGGNLQGKLMEENLLKLDGRTYPLPLKGEHNALNYLAAIAVAKILGIDLTILENQISVTLPEGRSSSFKLTENIEILDETYNAGLESMLASLQLLKNSESSRKIAVLGTMKELGDYSKQLHFQVGETVKNLGIDYLFLLAKDEEVLEIAQGAKGVKTEIFEDAKSLVNRLLEIVENGDSILFKASHSVGLNQVVEEFKKSYKL
jgi:UDP-N-acetylmuramoyl-tripeptide--D-alanyl-D-alanine ligase